MKARTRKPTKAIMEQFFKPVEKKGYPDVVDPNCDACGAHVIPAHHVRHVEWHLKLTKLIEGKRDKTYGR